MNSLGPIKSSGPQHTPTGTHGLKGQVTSECRVRDRKIDQRTCSTRAYYVYTHLYTPSESLWYNILVRGCSLTYTPKLEINCLVKTYIILERYTQAVSWRVNLTEMHRNKQAIRTHYYQLSETIDMSERQTILSYNWEVIIKLTLSHLMTLYGVIMVMVSP